ncbi:MAG: L-histidine N(alpha)-methyltransferase [Hyphomicrobiales bacterium]|nr:L-histidine N(alpha)-methyltransferase [Hyphomicrobiales bacterium]
MTVLMLKPRCGAEAIDGTERSGFRAAVLAGLAQPRKSIPSRFFYDKRGSELFEEITRLEEYYPTRAELEIYETYGSEIASLAPQIGTLVEFGSGSSRKIRTLLKAMQGLKLYAPIDISEEMLTAEAQALAADFPDLEIVSVHADFMGEVVLPAAVARHQRMAFFPGSTIGNFRPREALQFLERVLGVVGEEGMLLIGVDLKKDTNTLVRAYDDAAGVTAAFNLNLLHRINAGLGGNFDLAGFAHHVRYDEGRGRIEMHIKSLKTQRVRISGRTFDFAAGETIHTENSHKFTIPEFHLLARAAGFAPLHTWTDGERRFSVHLLGKGEPA